MDVTSLSGGAAIVGLGTHIVGRADTRITSLQLQVLAAQNALEDAGIDRNQVGAVFTGRAPMGYSAPQWNMKIINELKVVPALSAEMTVHGAGILGSLQFALMAVNSGWVDYALCSSGCTGPLWVDSVKVNASVEADLQFEAPYGPTTPALYALWATRYMADFGITSEQLARVAVENRKWALHHPFAAMRDKGPITVEDVITSRPIATPLRLLDCSPWYHGGYGTAMVIARADRASDHKQPVWLAGLGQRTTHEYVTERLVLEGPEPFDIPNLHTTGAKPAAQQAYEMAGWTPEDVDIVETSAPFTFANVMTLEDLGFCEKGEGGDFVTSGGIDFDGGLPMNTNGGYLSFGQAPNGMHMAAEAVQQLRGQAEGRQVPGASRALVHFHGGAMASHSVALLSKENDSESG